MGRWLLLGLLGVSLVLLSGCQATRPHPDVIHLSLWQGVNPATNRAVLQKLVDQFNQEHPTIQVDSLYVGQADQQLPKILAAVVGNAAPDILWFAPMMTGKLVELDAIRPLEDWFQKLPIRDEIDPPLFESMELEGHLWSVPFGMSNIGIFYRPSLFKAAGITQPPKTWADLRQTARTLTRDLNGDGRPDQHGMVLPLGKNEWTVFTWLPFMWSGGGELVAGGGKGERPERGGAGGDKGTGGDKEDRGAGGDKGEDGEKEVVGQSPKAHNVSSKIQLVNPGAIAALQLWQDLIQNGSAVLSAPERGYEMDGLRAGKVAMQISGPWTFAELQASGVDFGVMPIPRQQTQATVIGGENLFVFKTTPEREQAALKFLEYVLSERFQTQWATSTGYLPVNLKSRQSPEYAAFRAQQPALDMFLQQAQYARSRPIFPSYSRVSENLGRAIEAVLLGRSTPLEALKTSQERLDLSFTP